MRFEVHLLAQLVSCIATSDIDFLSIACRADLLAILLHHLKLISVRALTEV